MTPEHPERRQDRYATFCAEYKAAWEAAGKPTQKTVLAVYLAAMEETAPHDIALHPLWIFIKKELALDTCLTWFSQEPLRMLREFKEQTGFFGSSVSPHLQMIGMRIGRMLRDSDDPSSDKKDS